MKKRIAWLVAVLTVLSFPVGVYAKNQKLSARSYIDCRQCLELPTTEQIIKCAERYM